MKNFYKWEENDETNPRLLEVNDLCLDKKLDKYQVGETKTTKNECWCLEHGDILSHYFLAFTALLDHGQKTDIGCHDGTNHHNWGPKSSLLGYSAYLETMNGQYFALASKK